MKKKLAFLLFLFVSIFLIRHTIALKSIAPVCYRMDFSMAPILMVSVYLGKRDKKVWYAFGMKEILTLFFGNPGISFATHILLTLSNTIMDSVLLICYQQIREREGKKRFQRGLLSMGIYIVICTGLNAIYHAALSAFAYNASISWLVMTAGVYNSKVNGYGSFLVWSVAQFYFVKFLAVMLVTTLFIKIFCREDKQLCRR